MELDWAFYESPDYLQYWIHNKLQMSVLEANLSSCRSDFSFVCKCVFLAGARACWCLQVLTWNADRDTGLV